MTEAQAAAARAAVVALVVVVPVLIVAGVTRWVLFERLDRAVDRDLLADVARLDRLAGEAADADGAVPSVDVVLERFLSTSQPGTDGVYLGLVGGVPAVRSAGARYPVEQLEDEVRDWGSRTSATFDLASTPIGPLRTLVSPVTAQGDVVGTFVAGRFLQPGREQVGDAVRTSTVVGLAVWSALVGAGWWLLHRRPAILPSLRLPTATVDPLAARAGEAAPSPSRTRLLAGASRELAAASTAVRAHLHDAEPGVALSAGSSRVVLDELARMANVADDLALLGELEAPGALRTAPVDVGALAAEVEAEARSLGARAWEVRRPEHVVAELDAERIRRAWLHLARNAVEHSWRSDRITVFAEVVGGRLELGVADVGRGIETDDLESLFQPFHRGPGTARATTAGGGLGLTVARAVAEAHGGHVEVRSTAGSGATVVLSLPLERPVPGPG